LLRLADIWLPLVSGGPPTADKPDVTFASADPDMVSHASTLRVADCRRPTQRLPRGARPSLSPPHDWAGAISCSLSNLEGHLVEISQSVPPSHSTCSPPG
jgi:hypothetical protein